MKMRKFDVRWIEFVAIPQFTFGSVSSGFYGYQ